MIEMLETFQMSINKIIQPDRIESSRGSRRILLQSIHV